jgi:hypothetical protein
VTEWFDLPLSSLIHIKRIDRRTITLFLGDSEGGCSAHIVEIPRETVALSRSQLQTLFISAHGCIFSILKGLYRGRQADRRHVTSAMAIPQIKKVYHGNERLTFPLFLFCLPE